MQLLVVDDEPTQRQMLSEYLVEKGHAVREAAAAEEALDALRDEPSDLVLTDVRLPGADGVELIRRARSEGVSSAFLVLTAFGTIENAVEAMRAGAYDYLTKPVHLDDLDRALAQVGGRRKAAPPPEPPPADDDPFAGLGASMERLRLLIQRAAPTDATVLVLGESGTGKELVADRIHALSRRAPRPLVKINCASLPESLLEAELFGFTKGAFTGAGEPRAGLFEAADTGTLFLDEIGDVSPALQVRLLRVLQEREVMRLGTREPVPVDFRLVAATHRDLDAMVGAGEFREDLLYRLRVIEIGIAPLRERPEDIPVLARRLGRRLAARHRVPAKRLSADAASACAAHRFPGNVRELEHRLERGLILGQGEEITRADLDLADGDGATTPRTLREAVAALERSWIRDALDRAGGTRARAAKLLGVPDRVLRYKMRKYGIERRK